MIREQHAPDAALAGERAGRNGMLSAVAAMFIVFAIALGGASAAGVTPNAILQAASVFAIAVPVLWGRRGALTADRRLLLLTGLLAALFVLQLVPLPVVIWQALPGREPVIRGLAVLGIAAPWMPLSLAPARTLASGLALLPPVAMFVMLAHGGRSVARTAVIALIAVTLTSALIGVAQVAGTRALYFYANTNPDSAVGFFANANHFGTLMCVVMPLTAGVVAHWGKSSAPRAAASRGAALGLLLAAILLALLGLIMTKSVAAVLLACPALAASALIVLPGVARRLQFVFIAGVTLAVVIACTIAFLAGADGLVSTTVDASTAMGRPAIWHTTWTAIAHFGTVGSGFGTFEQVYHLFENPALVSATFANHAHNDVLEFVLEGGVPAVVLLVLFLMWFASRLSAIWLGNATRDPLAQGASVAATIILLHSIVDYPLRTAAIATVFGLCLALIARKAPAVRAERGTEPAAARHVSV